MKLASMQTGAALLCLCCLLPSVAWATVYTIDGTTYKSLKDISGGFHAERWPFVKALLREMFGNVEMLKFCCWIACLFQLLEL